ncbi:hypothetical protein DXN05_13220 [Deminuibacter soli]|uniref:BZIP transcription factor n=1 Tax=Deminuibacter soli TaxID=2291815 RepID=A0A3E1NI91_9BACT|nr:hypothetical protein DXN05_13220 [Deminuibacter soli]
MVLAQLYAYSQNSYPATGNVIIKNGNYIEIQDTTGATNVRLFTSKSTFAANTLPASLQLHRSYISGTDSSTRFANAASVIDILQFYTNSTPGIHLNGNTGGTSYFRSGMLGIGTTSPTAMLDVANNAVVGLGGDKFNVPLVLWKRGDQYGTDGAALIIRHTGQGVNTYLNPTSDYGVIRITGFDTTVSNKVINSHDNFVVYTNGAVAINTKTVPNGYKLAVKGKVIAESVKVKLASAGWPDYVFDSAYDLRTLVAVEQYIQQNKHLPDVPAASEIAEGVDLGANQAVLLRKIEELTLYLIEMRKENELLKKRMEQLENAKR